MDRHKLIFKTAVCLLMLLGALSVNTLADCPTDIGELGAPTRIPMSIWRGWGARDFLEYDGRLVEFESPAGQGAMIGIREEIISFERLSEIERASVNGIYAKIHFNGANVEYGAAVVTLKNGETFVVEVSDSRSTHIVGTTVTDALGSSLQQKGLIESDIGSLRFFHNHPSNAPLSADDIQMTRNWNQFYNLENPSPFPIDMLSVAYLDGQFVLFRYGLRSKKKNN